MPQIIDNRYKVIKKLGQGLTSKVCQVKDIKTGKHWAMKVMNSSTDNHMQQLLDIEVNAMKELDHQNLLKLEKHSHNGKLKQSSGTKQISYMLLELAQGGELFDFVAIPGEFTESVAQYFFSQLLSGLDYMHKQGYAHRDLKPENIMFDQQFNLKIADFGFATPIKGKDGLGYQNTCCGTRGYMAPEILLRSPYKADKTDIFSAGVILFMMVTARPPFKSAEADDPQYRLLSAGRYDLFWQTHDDAGNKLSKPLKSLINQMLCLNPAKRPSMSQIIKSNWMKQELPDHQDIMKEFEIRSIEVQEFNEQENTNQQKDQDQCWKPKSQRSITR